ncbi:serine/threonine protein kinase [Ktedonospora formicarum]|uniref:non-specific serine/threonine protein kinase n=1 Tax=Ktedonospora formicarum TaxID=2778364 RepID=A0A8J3HYK5_9CHLR|nr:serine/threonine-protein kinase [Ktedonospora formicarum]GHO43500.1 hypothetical protein KSX_16630 [Ktedonospora formicarum]
MNTAPHHLDNYELHSRLGRGNVGEVWKGRDLRLQRDVALKLLHTDLQQANPHLLHDFTAGGAVLKELHHNNIVPVREVNVYRAPSGNETIAYIVMDYIEGITLSAYLKALTQRSTFPPISQIVYLYSRLGEAIDSAHRRGVVHGNLKPGNVLLNVRDRAHFEAGEPLIADAGLCPLLGITPSSDMPFYISPEQAGGGSPNNRSDIYALGVILYEICTGVRPFRGESSIAVMMQHVNSLPTPPNLINPNIPPALSEVILRAMAKDPISRFASASQLANAVAEACSLRPSMKLRAVPPTPLLETGYPGGPGTVTILGVPQPAPRSQPAPFLPSHLSQQQPARNQIPATPEAAPPIAKPVPPGRQQLPTTPEAIAPVARPTQPQERQPEPPKVQDRTSGLLSVPQQQATPFIDDVWAASAQPTAHMVQMGRTDMAPFEPHPMPPVAPPIAAPLVTAPPIVNKPPESHPANLARRRFTDKPAYIFVIAAALMLLILGGALASNLWLQTHGPVIDYTGHAFFQDDALGTTILCASRLEMSLRPLREKAIMAG